MTKQNDKSGTGRKKVKRRGWDGEIVYAFKGVPVRCNLNADAFSDEQVARAEDAVQQLSREIWIDKTYVDFEGTKFEKTFLTESGWNALKKLVMETGYGLAATKVQRFAMDEAFRCMAVAYMKLAFEDLGWDVDEMEFYTDETDFDVEYYPDVAEEWRRYPGKWQTWEDS